MRVELDINKQKHAVEVEPRMTLLDCLRDGYCSTARTPVASTACAAPARC